MKKTIFIFMLLITMPFGILSPIASATSGTEEVEYTSQPISFLNSKFFLISVATAFSIFAYQRVNIIQAFTNKVASFIIAIPMSAWSFFSKGLKKQFKE